MLFILVNITLLSVLNIEEREEFPHLKKKLPTLWTNSYFVATVGGAPLEIIKQYIENQQTSEREKEKKKME